MCLKALKISWTVLEASISSSCKQQPQQPTYEDQLYGSLFICRMQYIAWDEKILVDGNS